MSKKHFVQMTNRQVEELNATEYGGVRNEIKDS